MRLLLLFCLSALPDLAEAAERPTVSIESRSGGSFTLRWPGSSGTFAVERATSLASPVWQALPVNPTLESASYVVTFSAADKSGFYRLRETGALQSVQVASSSPSEGETGVAVTREAIFRLSGPVAADTVLDSTSLFAFAAGRKLLSRVELSSDHRTATLFYLENLPADARVDVTFDGTGLFDANNLPVDLDGDGVLGGSALLTFQTLSTTALATTGVEGHVFASEKNADGSNHPLADVTITVDGMEETLRTTTDTNGFFRLVPTPSGRFFVSVDGRTAVGSQWPGGAYYPFVGKAWDAAPGRTNNLAGGSGVIYLPLIQADALKTVSATADTKISFASSVLATNPALAGVEITVPANTLFADNGTRGGKVGMAPVSPDRLPEPLPPGLNLPIVITIQTDGARNFDVPVPVKFPNLPDPVTGIKLGPGEKTALWSFNHDTGRWEIQGSMTISADGLFAVSDPGVGVRQPGWHGPGPGGPGGGPGGPGGPGPCTGNCDEEQKKKDPCDDKKAQTFLSISDLAFDAGFELSGAAPKDPFDACALGFGINASRTTRDCLLFKLSDCQSSSINNLIGTGIGCIPVVGGSLGLAWGAKGLIDASFDWYDCTQNQQGAPLSRESLHASAVPGGNVSATLARVVQLLEDQIAMSEAASNLLSGIYGDKVWSGARSPGDAAAYKALFENIRSALAATSPGGTTLTPAERTALEALPRPNGAALAQVQALLTRMERIVNGALTADDTLRNEIAAAEDQLLRVTEPLLAAGWEHYLYGFERALLLLSSLSANGLDPDAGGAVAAAAVATAKSSLALAVPVTGPKMYRFPLRPVFFHLVNQDNGFEFRGRLNSAGLFDNLILAPNALYRIEYFDSLTQRTGVAYFQSRAAGQTTPVPAALMFDAHGADTDGDSLTDAAEQVIGTNSSKRDTDADGVEDGVEIAAGTNPSDGQPLSLGMMAIRNTPGTALKIDTVNDLAVVADSSSLAVFNVANPLAPVLAGQFTPEGGVRVDAVATAGDFVAAVPGTGIASTARMHLFGRTVNGTLTAAGSVSIGEVATSVVAAGRYAYAPGRSANAPTLAIVRLRDSLLMRHVPVSGGNAIATLALDGDVLWGASTRRLFSYRIAGDSLQEVGGLDLATLQPISGDSVELAVGNGRAYVGDGRGYRIINITDPAFPVLLQTNSPSAGALRALAHSGAGVLLVGQLNVGMYDVKSDVVTNFLTTLITPDLPRDFVLHRGYALVADGAAGLGVVNFIAPDRGSVSPSIILRPFPSHPPASQESEEQFFVSTTTSDDVQVRDVEFYMDGVSVARSGKFPFAATLRAPGMVGTKTNFLLRAKATDTGGNSAWSQEITLTLLPDSTPARLLAFTPSHNSTLERGSLSSLSVIFDSVMQLTSFPGAWTLVTAGTDGNLGTADDVAVTGGEFVYDSDQRTVLQRFSAPLRSGKYRSRLAATITDLAGNPSGTNVTWDFAIPTAKPVELSPVNQSVWLTDTLRRVEVRFDERLSAASVTPDSLRILSTNVVNPIVLSGGATSLSSDGRGAVLEFAQPVPNGVWRLVYTPEIRDVFGSPVLTNLNGIFMVKGSAQWGTNISGAWEAGRNWIGGLAPILNDHVVIDRPQPDIVVTLSSDPTLTSLRASNEIFSNGRRLYVTGTADLSGPLRWNGRSTLAGGVIDLRGDTIVSGGGTGSPGTGNTFGPDAASLERGTLRNHGHIEVTAGNWLLETTNAVIENLASGVIRLAPTTTPYIERDRIVGTRGSGTPLYSRFVNHGLVEGLPDGRPWRFQSIEMDNQGILRLPNSRLEAESSFFHSAPGSTLDLSNLMLRFVSGTLLGNVRLQNGLAYTNNSNGDTLTLGGPNQDFGTNGILMYGGTIQVAAPLAVKRLNIQSTWSQLVLNSDLTVSDFASLRLQRVDGTGRLRLLGLTQYLQPATGVGSWNTYDTILSENFGTMEITNASITCYDSSLFINQPGALIEGRDGAYITDNFFQQRNAPVGTNYGTIRTRGTRESRFQLANEGRVEVLAGSTTFLESPHHGRFDVAAGAELTIEEGSLETDSIIAGEGQVVLKNLTARGRLDVRRVVFSSPTPTLEGDHVIRELELKNFAGTVQFQAQGNVEITEKFITSTNGATGIRMGTLRLGGSQLMGGAQISNEAALENAGQLTVIGFLTGPSNRSSTGQVINLPQATLTQVANGDNLVPFSNFGTFVKEGTGSLSFGNVVTNSGLISVRGGSVSFSRSPVQTPTGEIQLVGGNVALREHNSGILSGSGTNNSSLFINDATLRPGSPLGIFLTRTFSGRFEQTTNGVLEIEIAGLTPGTGHDQLVSEGQLYLAGTLRLSLRDGFVPALGQEFTVVVGTRISPSYPRFSTVEGTELGGGRRLDVLYETNRVFLRCVSAP